MRLGQYLKIELCYNQCTGAASSNMRDCLSLEYKLRVYSNWDGILFSFALNQFNK